MTINSTLTTGARSPALALYDPSVDVGVRPFTTQLWGFERVPSDPIGTCTRTFDGVPAGSEIRVYDPSRNELAGVETCDANHTLAWPVYAAGSANNTVRIVIVDMAHRIKEFNYTSSVGVSSIPVQAEIDKWYRNP